ncbi:DUF4157 domain-containing protein [Leptolyngbya sp. NK1-12]|uniref:DUF4157 domain-containing protein n=1 Tax=Leptolyngbya sp. NK1-12 TaxID=2547451 RepID=A0AA96WMX2_9CYAN|nr:DUF4157 domain-containing protein [Leptolyngbya sp. NK1-12]WNZ27755.1 DUF4157 domain-containing protein [Leptolyngbya sp. NK1-12]
MTSQRAAQAKTTQSAQPAPQAPAPQKPATHPLLHLQRQVGNQAATSMIQAKLTVGEPNDVYEQEADRVAAAVVNQIHAAPAQATQSALQTKPRIQRMSDVAGMAVSPDVESAIQQARGGGHPLDESIRVPMEQAFGADFSGVRVHADGESDRLARSIQARAFTTGQDIFFSQGTYDFNSRTGQNLLAHELTHVVQQNKTLSTHIAQRMFKHPKPSTEKKEADFKPSGENQKSTEILFVIPQGNKSKEELAIPSDSNSSNLYEKEKLENFRPYGEKYREFNDVKIEFKPIEGKVSDDLYSNSIKQLKIGGMIYEAKIKKGLKVSSNQSKIGFTQTYDEEESEATYKCGEQEKTFFLNVKERHRDAYNPESIWTHDEDVITVKKTTDYPISVESRDEPSHPIHAEVTSKTGKIWRLIRMKGLLRFTTALRWKPKDWSERQVEGKWEVVYDYNHSKGHLSSNSKVTKASGVPHRAPQKQTLLGLPHANSNVKPLVPRNDDKGWDE